MKKLRLILVTFTFIISCTANEFERKNIIGDYYLTTTDGNKRDVYIDFKLESGDFIGVIPSTVFSVGHDDKYIIAKQHPFTYPSKVDTSITNYYILPIQKQTLSPELGLLGPLTFENFEAKRKKMGIVNILFENVKN
ncbi:DUF3997 domain-containing protein [Pedobacter sp.]|jgi:hypothetical protein|uniref:DUF3997 domain-containing protein n=1 Tax=Pedobacter sp. TaxID=1411316 RepID=UPI002C50945F|nr:DUF3997 domain-containing protein [Pedobacter sp.]HWW40119.1 DUF3997 domain-containing protein [Pedobacter sp.]